MGFVWVGCRAALAVTVDGVTDDGVLPLYGQTASAFSLAVTNNGAVASNGV